MNDASHLSAEKKVAKVSNSKRICREIELIDEGRKAAVFSIDLAAGVFLVSFLPFKFLSGPWSSSAHLLFLSLAFFLLIRGLGTYRRYRYQFKEQIVTRIVENFFSHFQYKQDRGIAEKIYHQSELFKSTITSFYSEDHFWGKIGSTDIEFSEVRAVYESDKVPAKKFTFGRDRLVFAGILIHADFHKHFQGRTFVLPDRSERSLGKQLGGFFQNASGFLEGRGERVVLENAEFEEQFVVFADSQQEARYILTPKMQENILALQRNAKSPLAVSFIKGHVFVAISQEKNHFEPRLFSKVNQAILTEYIEILTLVTDIVSQLDLNTRIWSKS